MERNENRIEFDELEQSQYGVEPSVSIESALATSAVFGEVAAGLSDRAAELCDRSNPDIIALSGKLLQRAGELSAFRTGIRKLCAPEIDAEFMRQLDKPA